jgi:NitT/TauT family transport system substrate-binding protein
MRLSWCVHALLITDRGGERKGSRAAVIRSTVPRSTPGRLLVRVVVLLLVLIVGAVAARAEPITIAIVPSVPAGSTLIAEQNGYFRDAGLDVKIERIDSLGKAVAFLAANHVQVTQGGINAGIFNSIGQGLPVTLALDGGSTPLYHRILVRRELADKIKTVADLKGRTVGLSAPGSTSMYELAMTLATAGLTLKDVEVKHLAFSQMATALANGALDAGLAVAPFTEIATGQGTVVPWIDPEAGYIKTLPMTSVAYIVNTDWAAKNADAAKKLMLALARGSRDYCQAYHHGPNRGEMLDVMMKNRIASDRALLDRMDWQARNPDGAFSVASLVDIQAFFKREGIIDKISPPERLVDPHYAEMAAREFGPFEVINKASKLEGCR